MLKHVMRAGDTFENPAFVLQAALYVAVVGEHPVPDRMSRFYIKFRSSLRMGARSSRSRRVQQARGQKKWHPVLLPAALTIVGWAERSEAHAAAGCG